MFPSRVASLKVSGIRKLFEAAPPGAINLGLGEPDIQPPVEMIDALKSALDKGFNKYGPSAGIMELRLAIADNLRRYRKDVSFENVIVTAGATEGMRIACETIIGEGDEALVPNPGFIIYGPDVRLAGGRPVEYSLRLENGYLPDPEQIRSLVTPRTKAIVMNSPSNPTGSVFPRDTMKAICEIADDKSLYILSDEVYNDYVYEGEHWSPARFHDDTIVVNSFSKSLAATGWRIGYVATSKEIVKQLAKVQYYTLACPPTATQYAVLEGMKVQERFMRDVLTEFRMRREIAMKRLSEISSFRTAPVSGAFYLFPEYDHRMPSEDFAQRILERGVICAPGSAFGSLGEGHLRFSYANSRENISRGLDIVKDVAAEL
ncbi:MAG: aspartate aminotransferase [Candidatus Thorarchaeota archaeon]|nr:MAG: aspartate aminotransferase [Candidatus Thorarchaeota archaeon]